MPSSGVPNRLYSMTRAGAVARLVERRHLDDRRQKSGALVEIGRLEERLLLARFERADHRDRGDEPHARHRSDRVPIGLDLVMLKISPEAAQQPIAVKAWLVVAGEVAGEFAPFRHDPPIALKQRQFFANAEPADAGQG